MGADNLLKHANMFACFSLFDVELPQSRAALLHAVQMIHETPVA
jgi:hypothetical protein